MINGFDAETAELSEYELREIVPWLVAGLRQKVGKRAAVRSTKIIEGMERMGKKLTGARLRKCVNYIRVKGLVPCLIATTDGYYVGTEESELKDYENSLLGRELAIRQVRECLTRQRMKRFENN